MRTRFPRAAVGAVLAGVLGGVSLGCGGDSFPTEVAAPGAPAQIVMSSVWFAGGHEYREETRIDSASQRFTVRSCSGAPIAAPCPTLALEREGAVLPNILQELFAATTRREFRRLESSYPNPQGVTPPDGGSTSLEVVRNGTRRTITWSSNAPLPLVLVDVWCLIRAARGDLLLCD